MYRVVYIYGNSKIKGQEEWEKFKKDSVSESEANKLIINPCFGYNFFQRFLAAVDIFNGRELISYGRISYSDHRDNFKSLIWEGIDMKGKPFAKAREGSNYEYLYTPFTLGDALE